MMGCASCRHLNYKHFDNELYETEGIGLEYLQKGCPFYMGSLWNVTDGDSDFLFMELLKKVLKL